MARDGENASSGSAGARSNADAIHEIDGLRGIAIFMVMVHRLWPRDAVNRFGVAADAGWIGVDLFFVVSGFLITRILLETRGEPGYFRNFYARRVLRIFPLYYLFVGTLFIVFPLAGNSEYLDHSGSPAWYLLFLGNVPEGLLGYDPPYWLGTVWSLAIEEQFYLTFPLLVWWLGARRLGPVLLGLFMLAPTVRLATMLAAPDMERIQYLFTLCRVDAIAAGCMIALIMRWKNVMALRGLAIVIACWAGAIAVIGDLDRTTPFGRVAGYSFVAIGFAALVVAVLTSRDRWWTKPLRFSPLRYAGRLCFGLYLLHRPADTFVTEIANHYDVDADRISWMPIKIAVAFVLATGSWLVIEKPFLRLKRKFVSPRHPAAFAITIVLLAAACHDGASTSPDALPVLPDGAIASIDAPGVSDAQDAMDAAMPAAGTVLYPEGARHSPITPAIVAHLQGLTGGGLDDHVFAKVGDSITDTPEFLACFDGGNVDLGAHTALGATIQYFMQGHIAAATPRYAVLLLGTNDNRYFRTLDAYAVDLWNAVDRMLAMGVVPIMSTLPPMHSYPEADVRVPLFNLVVRAIAQGRGVPLVDLYGQLAALPGQGISGDGIHPTVAPGGGCQLTAAGLQYGYNMRNLVVLEALARTRAALAGMASDASASTRAGAGTTADPFLAALPLVDLGDSRTGAAVIDTHTSCGAAAAFGHEIVYAVHAAQPTIIDAYVVDRETANLDLYILAASPQGACVGSGDASVTAVVPAGTFYVIVDAPTPLADGEYLLVVRAR